MGTTDDMESSVMSMLKPMFPNLSSDQLKSSVFHPKNRQGDVSEGSLFQRCLDDLLNVSTETSSNLFTGIPGYMASPKPLPAVHKHAVKDSPVVRVRNNDYDNFTTNHQTLLQEKTLKRPGNSVNEGAIPAKSSKLSSPEPTQSFQNSSCNKAGNTIPSADKDSWGSSPQVKVTPDGDNTKRADGRSALVKEITKELETVKQTFARKNTGGSSLKKKLMYAVCPSCRKNSITMEICSYCGSMLPRDVQLVDRNLQASGSTATSTSSSSVSISVPTATLSRPDSIPSPGSFPSSVKLRPALQNSSDTESETGSETDQNSQGSLPDTLPSENMEAAALVEHPMEVIKVKPVPTDNVVIQKVEPPVVIVEEERTPVPNPVDQMVLDVVNLFSDVDPEYVRDILVNTNNPNPVNVACNILLENPQYPRLKKITTVKEPESPVKESTIDYYSGIGRPMDRDYREQCLELLKNDFKKMSVKDLRSVATHFNYHYAPARKCIITALESTNHSIRREEFSSTSIFSSPSEAACPGFVIEAPSTAVITVQLPEVEYKGENSDVPKKTEAKILRCNPLKAQRQRRKIFSLCDELKNEIDFIMNKSKEEKMEKDFDLAMTLNEAEYEDAGQSIECQCCFGEFPFEQIVQCYEGHLFCQGCLKNYAKESVYGQGKAELGCMTDGCDATYPKSQLEKALSKEIMNKYEERTQEENLNLAAMEGFVRCTSCEFGALMDPDDKVFRCQNPECMKETCRYCKEEWEEHFGKPCKEIEKKDETKLRLAYEEKMTEAKVRRCHRCKTMFMKSDGCNRMTCRCGAKMCYICQKPDIDYNHFCGHPREPGHPCDKCTACSLWTNPEEDDERAVDEIRKEAAEERKRHGFMDEKLVGASPERIKKKTGHAAMVANAAHENRPPPRPADVNLLPQNRPRPQPANQNLHVPPPAHQNQPAQPVPHAAHRPVDPNMDFARALFEIQGRLQPARPQHAHNRYQPY